MPFLQLSLFGFCNLSLKSSLINKKFGSAGKMFTSMHFVYLQNIRILNILLSHKNTAFLDTVSFLTFQKHIFQKICMATHLISGGTFLNCNLA